MYAVNCFNQILLFALLQLKSAYAIMKLRKTGYSKSKFYNQAVTMYTQVYKCYIL